MSPTLSRRAFLISSAAAVGAALVPIGARAADAETFEVVKTEAEWRKILSPAAYSVLRDEETERAGTSPLDKEHRTGVFKCAGCGLALFSSDNKFDSGTGWPSFWKPLDGAIRTRKEGIQYFIPGTEVHCRRCGGHLGHVFDDGPAPTHLRYCINGVALAFEPGPAANPAGAAKKG